MLVGLHRSLLFCHGLKYFVDEVLFHFFMYVGIFISELWVGSVVRAWGIDTIAGLPAV